MRDNRPAKREAYPGVLKSAVGFLKKRPNRRQGLNLALQGGGAHGAFTWGVLDCLLEASEFQIDGISGTSAGAINAVALAAGFMEGGAEGARKKLEEIWRATSRIHCFLPFSRDLDEGNVAAPNRDASPAFMFVRAMTRMFSPYEFNPLEIDPLRRILKDHIDFEGLRRYSPISVFVNATEASSGRGRIFTGDEISIDAVLASACLPSLRHAVKIGRHHYWDGGFSANPPLLPLIEGCQAADTLIVRLTPALPTELPTRATEIQGNVNRIMFNQPLRKDIELIEMARRMATNGTGHADTLGRRMHEHRFHVVDGARYTAELHQGSALTPDWDLLAYLNQSGRSATATWLKRNKTAVGQRSTVDLVETFL